ncbi:MAG: phosphoserine phosphatase SerB [Actinomycetota bacterium]
MVFDVDSTLIEDEAIELLAEASGTREKVAEITERAMRGEIDFAASLIERVATLAGLSDEVLERTSKMLRPTPGARELIQEIHARGGKVAAVSGGFNQLLEPLKQELQLDYALANTLDVVDAKLTGKLTGETIDRAAKAKYLELWASELGLRPNQTIAVGDGANDLGMMEKAGLSVAFCAKPKVREQASVAIDDRDLRNLISVLP